jgi:hypothetical protein
MIFRFRNTTVRPGLWPVERPAIVLSTGKSAAQKRETPSDREIKTARLAKSLCSNATSDLTGCF